MDLTVDRVGAGSLTRASGRVTDGEEERYRGCSERGHKRGNMTEAYLQRARFVCVVHDRGPPLAVFKARNVAPSRGMRQSIITVLHIDTTVRHRATSRARTHTQIHRYIHDQPSQTPRLAPRSVSLSLSFSRSLYLGHTHTPRTNDTASYNTRASNIIGPILPPREINVST